MASGFYDFAGLVKTYDWWRWRESNPRPQALRHRLYMLISSINLALYYPTNRENTERFWISFNESTPEMLHRDLT